MSKLFTSPAGLTTFLVGGYVRDMLMGLEAKDADFVVVGSDPDQMLGLGFEQVGADFPVFLHPQTRDEYALARTERKSGPGYQGFTVMAGPEVTLVEDLARRDLTINAMAMDAEGVITDPHGGLRDLEAKVLRHVSDEAFSDDPVRLLRLARFAARYTDFTIAPETLEKATAMTLSGEVNNLVPERVWAEISKGLMEAKPSRMFEVLRECGALAVLFPELNQLWGVIQNPEHHPEVDTFVHTMMAVDYAAKNGFDLSVRYAVLVHDLGKGLTPTEMLPAHHDHDALGVALVRTASNRMRAPTALRDLGELVCAEHIQIHGCHSRRESTLILLLMRLDAFRRPERFEKILQACESDARGRLGLENKVYTAPAYLRQVLAFARTVDVGAIVESCKKPKYLKDQILENRVRAVRAGLLAT